MNAIKKARRMILATPSDPSAKTLASLVLSLESDAPMKLGDLYQLGHDDFNLALKIIEEWRLDRYYMGKAKLFDVSWQARELQ